MVGKLRKSEAIQGTVTWVDSVERLRLLKDLFLSFQPAAGLTVVLTGPAKDVEGVTHTRLRLRRQDSETSLESVGLIMLGKGAPWRLPATQVDVGAVKTVKRTELRIAVPVHFRRDFVAEPQNQTVKDLLAELAKWSQVRPCHLTGGNWNWQQIHPESRKEHAQLVGWLRLPDEEAQKLLKVSGQRGIFVSQQGLQDQPKIWWMKRQESEAHSDYYKRILDFASTRSQSPVFRKGLGNDLGVPLLPGDQPLNRTRNIQISGVLKGWQAEELRDLLLQQKWSNIEIHRPVRKRRQVFWNARATPPASVSNQAAWSYECDDEFCITVNENMSRPSLPTVVTSAPRPRKKWQDRPSEDSPSNKDRGRKPSAAPKEQRIPEKSRERSRSPRETKEGEGDALADQPPQQSSMDVEVKPTRPDASQSQSQQDAHDAPPPPAGPPGDPVSSKDAVLQGWGVVDQGGVGDSAWRAIADNFWFQKEGLSLSQAESVRRANALRAQAVQHVRKHAKYYRAYILGADQSQEAWERCLRAGGSKPEDFWEKTDAAFEGYLAKAATPEYWIDGLLLQACSEKLGACIVVHAVGPDGKEQRYAIAPDWKGEWPRVNPSAPCVVVILSSKHYTSLRPPPLTQVPSLWLRRTKDPQDEDLRGGGGSSTPSICTLKTSFKRPRVSSAVALPRGGETPQPGKTGPKSRFASWDP